MQIEKIKELEKKIDEFGQFPIGLEFWFMEQAPDKIEVDCIYLQQILKRLVKLKEVAPGHLAEADIPRTIEYLISVVPDNVKKRYFNTNSLCTVQIDADIIRLTHKR